MKIDVSRDVVTWFNKEYDIKGKRDLRLFVRYGGVGGNIPAFSLGVNIEAPENTHASTTVDNLTFFIVESDAWYFEEKDLSITLNEQLHEPKFEYIA